MKKFWLLLVSALLISNITFANPIMPESLIYEIYFDDDDNWYLVVDVFFMEMLGIQTFQEIEIYSTTGAFVFKEDFLPDFTTYETIITQQALVYPHQMFRESDYVYAYWPEGWFEFMYLEWGNSLYDPVKGPYPGQSLIPVFVHEDEFYNPEYWLVKCSAPWFLGNGGLVTGEFEGFLFDQDEMPVANAEIKYVEEYLLNPNSYFPPLITNESGYFFHDEMLACNFHLYGVEIDGVDYDFNDFVSIEPDSTNTVFLQVVLTEVHSEHPDTRPKISNFPNPFNDFTTFVLQFPGNCTLQYPVLKIVGLMGQVVSQQPVTITRNEYNIVKFTWTNTEKLPSGIYSCQLIDKGLSIATGKMLIQ